MAMSYKAHLALASVKGDLSRRVAYYNKGLLNATKETQKILSDVERAARTGEFEVWYQPQINYSSGKLIGAEALVRWNHHEKGIIYPSSFIPLLEQSKQISVVDRIVWEEAVKTERDWLGKGLSVPVSVNVSRADILDPTVPEVLISLADKYSVPHNMIHLEITESAYVTEQKELFAAAKAFTEAGFIVEMDDFGSAYSTLNILKEIDISVDLLHEPEKTTFEELDPKEYGVIVSFGAKRGLLLPNLEGIDTSEQQVAIAMEKGNIRPSDNYVLERFKISPAGISLAGLICHFTNIFPYNSVHLPQIKKNRL